MSLLTSFLKTKSMKDRGEYTLKKCTEKKRVHAKEVYGKEESTRTYSLPERNA